MSSQIQTSPSKLSAASPSKRPSTTQYKPFSHIGEAEEGKPWSTRVRISRKWNELDFMGTNEVTSLDLFLIDENGAELHGVVPKKLIWKFDPLLRVGGIYSLNKFTILGEKKIFRPAHNEHRLFFNWDTEVKSMCSNSIDIPDHKFNFTDFEDLESRSCNTYLYLTNPQQVKKKTTKDTSTMRDFTLQNLSRNIDTHGIKETPVVVVVSSTYVRKYQGKYLLSSTNATKVLPFPSCWNPSGTPKTRATAVLTDNGWYYLGCNKCPTKVVGEEGNYGCTKCENKVEEPIPRFEEGKSKVVQAFDGLFNVDREYQITLAAFNNKKQTTPSFTVSRMPCPAIRPPSDTPTPSSPVVATPKDESDTNTGDTTPTRMNKTGRQEDQVTPSKRKKIDISESDSAVLSSADE
ncbi:hypothetical protein MKW94_023832 [Papaver nudicaule]|uniref:Replication protein A 70 kDa DNA-binding subunit B/D first OB fold domain-containing protein n=1 Tax=Papaver nudicaule TaxID=74823 RepID=A0AA42ASZ0_PAPNU|nr:hypothetical protein [Papaver nudicaule]